MVRPFDVSKFRKSITKSIGGISTGFDSDPDTWISTGNYTLNYLISGDFNKGVPLGRVTMLAGESGSGKSLIASGNIIKNAQDQGIFCIVFDSENALDEKWLQNFKEVNLDKIRFLAPVPVNSKIRMHSKILEVKEKWTPNKVIEAKFCSGTTSLELPAVRMISMERKKYFTFRV